MPVAATSADVGVHGTHLAGVVLAAGLGTRLRPLTEILPKALCPVANIPLVDIAVDHVRGSAAEVAVNVHHHRECMEAHLAGRGLHVSIEEDEPLGTAGAIGHLREWIDGRPALVHNVDAWHGGDLASFLDGWDRDRIRLMVVPARPGMIDFEQRWTFAGVSLLPWPDIAALPAQPAGLYESSWRRAEMEGRLELVPHLGPWFDTGTPSSYLAANLSASRGESVVAPDAVIGDGAEVVRSVVWGGARVEPGERLVESIRAPGGVTVDAPQVP